MVFVVEAEASHLSFERLEGLKPTCRLCGDRMKTATKGKFVGVKQCAKFAKDVINLHNIDFNEDEHRRRFPMHLSMLRTEGGEEYQKTMLAVGLPSSLKS